MIFSSLRIPTRVPSTVTNFPSASAARREIMLRYSGLSGSVVTSEVNPRSAASAGAFT